ncbi:hypothetical protein C9884_19030 [Klebsiella pneumoniae]|nr:hypothetical protein C9884_19030 [Klebsiella pneumoniae]
MTTDITELAQSLKAAATNVKETAHIARYLKATIARQTFKELMTPENILALVEALEKAQQRIADSESRVSRQNRHVCELFDDNTALRQRVAELESRLNSADKLQDSAFRSGLQHGFSLGQTDDQKGYEQSMAAYSPTSGIQIQGGE